MPGANSVTSNQETLHKDLEEVVRKYAQTTREKHLLKPKNSYGSSTKLLKKEIPSRHKAGMTWCPG